MRRIILVIACSVITTQASGATGALPHIKKGTPYSEARAQMIRAGFRPQPILKRPDDVFGTCGGESDLCRIAPEVIQCSVGGSCSYLFVRDTDGAPVFFAAYGEGLRQFIGMHWADRADRQELRRFVIAKPVLKGLHPGP